MKLDEIDSQIIAMLQEDGRRSFSDIAAAIDRTEVTVRRRVNRLKNEGYIKRFTVVLDPMKIGKSIRAIIMMVTVDDLTQLYQFLEKRLGGIEGMGDAETCIVLEEIKSAFSTDGAP